MDASVRAKSGVASSEHAENLAGQAPEATGCSARAVDPSPSVTREPSQRSLGIVVDSTAMLTRAEAASLDVSLVSNTYVLDGRECAESFMDANDGYDDALRAGRITDTHAAGVEAFRAAFEPLVAAGRNVLCVTLSSRLAGAYRNACKAADQVQAGREPSGKAGHIAVLDSLSGFSSIEYLVRRARGLEAQGRSFDEVVDDLVAARERQGICFSVLTTEPLRMAGRLSMLPQSLTTLLNRMPVLTMRDGAIACAAVARGTDVAAREMVAQVPAGARDLTLAHYGARGPLVVELLKAAKAAFPQARIRVKDGGPVLSCNLGAGAASISWAPAEAE